MCFACGQATLAREKLAADRSPENGKAYRSALIELHMRACDYFGDPAFSYQSAADEGPPKPD